MVNKDFPLTKKEFDEIYSKVPRLTVEIIVRNDEGAVYLTKRAIEPCVGQWHLPGGTVLMGETLEEAVKRIAGRELNIAVKKAKNTGYIEYPSHYKQGLDYPIGIVFEVQAYSGRLVPNRESLEGDWFDQMPQNMHADQDEYLLQNGYLHK